ncbi:uncharacterized protein LOC126894752 isoform X3 [Daktulosphaira vitifoliae]|uniref:uncharacterized protein LOC126894752 isoform X3 n=1 Tax=Daktulosphaira vitifoliae TaxID=58002 RepID=UPI0021AAD5B1|nr:uncharacterized protein LOC126894752 isoform X3 [Daktulosphaira vitifoliae]
MFLRIPYKMMITFGQHYAITLAAHHHKTKQLHDEQYNHQTHHNTSPGGVNILLGGVMMSSMILFILWMCYCCRWKDNKFETSSYVDQPQPYWIDVNPTTYYETLQWSLQQVIKMNVVKYLKQVFNQSVFKKIPQDMKQ